MQEKADAVPADAVQETVNAAAAEEETPVQTVFGDSRETVSPKTEETPGETENAGSGGDAPESVIVGPASLWDDISE